MSEAVSWRRWQPDDLSGERERRDSVRRSLTSELNALRSQAREEGRQQGYEEGYADGYEQGLNEGRETGNSETKHQRKELLAPLEGLARNFSNALSSMDKAIAEDITRLALLVGRHLADDALKAEPQQVCRLVRNLLREESASSEQVRLWLHPEDLPLVQADLGDELNSVGWRLEQDPRLSRGGCRVTTPNGELDATREVRWQEVLKHSLPFPQCSNHRSGATE
ncbi:flagellar assembly protein FliH [Microbulbifer elongatus]|uniref:Flagellar assembly protein FliH n=1 Tax=Microbulbifer elongatus TaxID=86173 RepID=A0ABT1NX31_9GAMM|nr:flagellar assembly protein FliH [Microbulbifer elongatus]MCQ3828351.1 flagellar assembly protein FliH [Microbulbifer elongatus]